MLGKLSSRGERAGIIVLLVGVAEVLACIAGGVTGCKAVSLIGGEAAYLVLGLLAYVVVSGAFGIRLVSSLALGSALGVFLKVYINLPRPPENLWLVHASGPGFPSGHALMSSLFWGIIIVETWSVLSLLGGALAVLAVSSSRLVLHVHYLRDVVGGILAGSLLALLYLLLRRRYSSLRLSAVMVAAAAPLAVLALIHSPGYDSAQHVVGLVLGLGAGLALLSTGPGKRSLVERLSPLQALLALAWAGIGLAVAFATRTGPESIPGFALFAFLATTSRPLAMASLGRNGFREG